ncbi:probable RNA-directed DNA polymerase from transposon BS [Trichonephila clavipes]|nr:probable RNA-directed DNA polymerase from transposon BS [Trichonephila clavipes]
MPDHHPDEPFYVRAVTELQDIEEAMTLAIVLETTVNDELNLSQNKFELPQGVHFNNLEDSGPVENGNNPNGSKNSASQNAPQTQLPPPIMLFVEENYKAQMAAITKAFPKIRSRLKGEFLKLYTDSAEERRMAVQHLTMLVFQFYTIKSKAERPIKVVIKGLPRNTNPEEIKQDLEILGYTPDRVNQLIGRKNKRPLPIFLITLPRNLDNLKIFDLKTINYLSIRVEGYDMRTHLSQKRQNLRRTAGGTLILVKNSLKHYCLPTPPLRALEATNIILTPPKHDPISITCVYIPPSSDENLFTIDIEHFIQIASNCILFREFNATHNAWNCKNNTTRGRHLFNFANILNLNIAFPSTPTRFGHNSANTIDIALIKNFYYPFTINSIDDLSSDHNPVFLNFNFNLAEAPPNPRAVSTDWNAFKINLNKNLSLFDFHPNNINNNNDLEQKITEFTEAVIDTHSHASRPIETDRRNFTPHNINQLIKIKNYFRKRYHPTLNPIFKSHYNRAQSDLKKELKKYNDIIWQKRLEGLNTADNSLWRTQKFFKNKRPKIPPLNCVTGTAVTDQQKANLLATNIKNNFVENDREDDSYNQNYELINTTVNNFLSTPPNSFIEPALPDEIIHYIKHVNAKKAPGKDYITNRMLKNFPIKLILILTILINKILKFNHFPDNWKEAIIFPINKPGKDPHLASSYRPISLFSTIGKLTESIILHRLKNFINENNILNPNQYGFTNKLSTLHPLLRLTENISEGFQKKKSTGAVFLDIQKAFDRVWINGLTLLS